MLQERKRKRKKVRDARENEENLSWKVNRTTPTAAVWDRATETDFYARLEEATEFLPAWSPELFVFRTR